MKIDPENNNETWNKMQGCMDIAMQVIPAQKHKATPLYLGATAGMRLLQ